jgi:hypothetical protein
MPCFCSWIIFSYRNASGFGYLFGGAKIKNIFADAGFKYRASYTTRQQRYALFYLKGQIISQIKRLIVNISDAD